MLECFIVSVSDKVWTSRWSVNDKKYIFGQINLFHINFISQIYSDFKKQNQNISKQDTLIIFFPDNTIRIKPAEKEETVAPCILYVLIYQSVVGKGHCRPQMPLACFLLKASLTMQSVQKSNVIPELVPFLAYVCSLCLQLKINCFGSQLHKLLCAVLPQSI